MPQAQIMKTQELTPEQYAEERALWKQAQDAFLAQYGTTDINQALQMWSASQSQRYPEGYTPPWNETTPIHKLKYSGVEVPLGRDPYSEPQTVFDIPLVVNPTERGGVLGAIAANPWMLPAAAVLGGVGGLALAPAGAAASAGAGAGASATGAGAAGAAGGAGLWTGLTSGAGLTSASGMGASGALAGLGAGAVAAGAGSGLGSGAAAAGAGGTAGLTSVGGGSILGSLLGGGSTSSLVVQGLTSLVGMGLQTYMSSQALDELASSSAAAGDQLAAANYAAIAEQRRASEASLGYLTESRDMARADLEPWRQAGISGLNQLVPKVLAGPGDYTKSPGYDFRMTEGVKALERGAAARGKQLSGAENKALTEYGQNYATADYDNFLRRYYESLNPLETLSGLGQNTASTTAAIGSATGTAAANMAANTGTNVSNLTAGLGTGLASLTNTAGQQRASAYTGLGNMYTGALNQFGTNMAYQNQLSQLAQLYGVR